MAEPDLVNRQAGMSAAKHSLECILNDPLSFASVPQNGLANMMGATIGRLIRIIQDAIPHLNQAKIMADRITERRRYAKTAAKFAKLAALNTLQDEGDRDARRAKKAMQDTWTKRNSRNPGDLHKPGSKRGKDAGAHAGIPALPALPGQNARRVQKG